MIAIVSTVKHFKKIDIAKALLILPFCLHDNTTKYLNDKRTNIRSIEEFIQKKPSYFYNFNKRYYYLLTKSYNALLLANELGFIKIQNGNIVFVNTIFDQYSRIGKRATNIINASGALSEILKQNTSSLYLHLRINI